MPRPTHFFIFSQQENHATNIPIILTNVYILLHYYCLLLPFLIDYKKKKFTPFSHFPVVFLFYIIIVISILRSDFMKKLKTTQQCSATSTSSTVISCIDESTWGQQEPPLLSERMAKVALVAIGTCVTRKNHLAYLGLVA